jgi:hypothetical protein
MRTSFFNSCYLITVWFVASCLLASAQGSGKKVAVDSLLHLERGQSQKKIEEVFGTPARHEFTARIDDRLLRCASFAFDSTGRYYFVFTNDALAKICEVTPFEFRRVPYKDTWWEIPVRADPEKRLKKVLDSPDLVGAALSESLKRRGPPPKSGSMNVLPAFIVAAPFWAAAAPLRAERRAEVEALAKKFDPYKVKLGMSVEHVEEMFGKPHVTDSVREKRETRYYGSARLGESPLLWISVVFEDGRTVRVFSGDFFDMDKIFKK